MDCDIVIRQKVLLILFSNDIMNLVSDKGGNMARRLRNSPT